MVSSDRYILVLSPNARRSRWISREADWILSNRSGRLIPVIADNCDSTPIHRDLKRIQYLDWQVDSSAARDQLIGKLIDAEYLPYVPTADRGVGMKGAVQGFWGPLVEDGMRLVVGRHEVLVRYEPSGMLGPGTMLAYTELDTQLRLLGLKSTLLDFADRLIGNDLRVHLVLLGGPDANALTKRVARDLESTIRFGDPERNEVAFYASHVGKLVHYAPRLDPQGKITADLGAVFWIPSPFERSKRTVVVAGSSGYGTCAAIRSCLSEGLLKHPFVQEGRDVECLIETNTYRETPLATRVLAVRDLATVRKTGAAHLRPRP